MLRLRTRNLGVRHDRLLEGLRSLTHEQSTLRDGKHPAHIDFAAIVEANDELLARGEAMREHLVTAVHDGSRLERAIRREVREWQRVAVKLAGHTPDH